MAISGVDGLLPVESGKSVEIFATITCVYKTIAGKRARSFCAAMGQPRLLLGETLRERGADVSVRWGAIVAQNTTMARKRLMRWHARGIIRWWSPAGENITTALVAGALVSRKLSYSAVGFWSSVSVWRTGQGTGLAGYSDPLITPTTMRCCALQ